MRTKLQVTGNEPITVEEAMIQCYLIPDDPFVLNPNDPTHALLTRLISVARATAEDRTWRSYVEKTVDGVLNEFPKEHIELPFPRLKAVTELTYTDTSGDSQTLTANTDYIIDTFSEPGRVYPVNGWPSTKDVPNAVQITYTTEGECPKPVKHGILYLVKHLYDNRDMVMVSEGRSVDAKDVPQTFDLLVNPYSLRRFV